MLKIFVFVLMSVQVNGQQFAFCNETTFTLKNDPHIRSFDFPRCPTEDSYPRFTLYSRNNSEFGEDISFDHIPSNYVESKPLYLIVHGFKNFANATWVLEMKDAFLEKEDVNILTVDWGVIANQKHYSPTAFSTPYVGSHIAKLIKKIRAEKGNDTYIWCIGHSLGAHVCHYASYKLTPIFNRISGLDPAGPMFENLNRRGGLNPDSAQFVDVIHTSGIFGTIRQLGHSDFYPNGGTNQPGCLESVCMHTMAYKFFIQSIKTNCYEYPLTCDLDPSSGEYDFEDSCEFCYDCPPMGYLATKPQSPTVYFLRTKPTPPYCSIWSDLK